MDVEFTHVRNLTGYMQRVVHRLSQEPPGRILDVPAGAGQVSEALRSLGHEVVSGDINEDQEHFVKVDLEGAFPFETDSFDVAICLEGIEHVLNGVWTLSELIRIVRPGGLVCISTPNVMNYYSRWHALLHGYPYQFTPTFTRRSTGGPTDRGHVNPMSLLRLDYVLGELGADIISVDGDKTKRRWMLPMLAPLAWLGDALRPKDPAESGRNLNDLRRWMRSRPLRRSRSLIVWARVQ